MTYLDKLDKSSKGADNMRLQIKQYLEEANKALKLVMKKKVRMCTLPFDLPQEIAQSEMPSSRCGGSLCKKIG